THTHTTLTYTLSLHDALPIFDPMRRLPLPEAPKLDPGLNPNQPKARIKQPVRTIIKSWPGIARGFPSRVNLPMRGPTMMDRTSRSEEHTSELQSRENLVCRLL